MRFEGGGILPPRFFPLPNGPGQAQSVREGIDGQRARQTEGG